MRRPTNYWTKERCAEEALKYESKKDFRNKSKTAYGIICKNDWLDEMCVHMPNIFMAWTKEKCFEEALKYKTKVDFQKNSGSAYQAARKNKWLKEISQHMLPVGNLKKRCVYAAEFSDNHVYIGLTYLLKNRIDRHLNDVDSSIFKHIQKSGIVPEFKQITKYIKINDAISKEEYYVNYYKNKKWFILNQSKTGTIGGSILIWTKEKCVSEALKYKTRTEYNEKSKGSYLSAYRNGWLDEICSHMIIKWKYWNFKNCGTEALKYITRNEFQIKSRTSYDYARKKGWLNEICQHMPKK
jgi:predicted GIY-YIG superfamily endonuclease